MTQLGHNEILPDINDDSAEKRSIARRRPVYMGVLEPQPLHITLAKVNLLLCPIQWRTVQFWATVIRSHCGPTEEQD